MASSLNCPTCGAPAASPDATRCEYCGSTLATVACPSCMGVMFVGMEFCPRCGAKAARAEDDGGASLPCPGCHGEMRSTRVGDTPMHQCASCASLWLAADAFTALCVNREERGAVTAFVDINRAPGSGAMPAATEAVHYVPCPVCSKIMNRQNFGHRSGVIIDVCKGHGVWFERDELRAALAFIDSGGFERARQADEARRAEEYARLAREFQQLGHVEATLEGADRARRGAGARDGAIDQALRALFA